MIVAEDLLATLHRLVGRDEGLLRMSEAKLGEGQSGRGAEGYRVIVAEDPATAPNVLGAEGMGLLGLSEKKLSHGQDGCRGHSDRVIVTQWATTALHRVVSHGGRLPRLLQPEQGQGGETRCAG